MFNSALLFGMWKNERVKWGQEFGEKPIFVRTVVVGVWLSLRVRKRTSLNISIVFLFSLSSKIKIRLKHLFCELNLIQSAYYVVPVYDAHVHIPVPAPRQLQCKTLIALQTIPSFHTKEMDALPFGIFFVFCFLLALWVIFLLFRWFIRSVCGVCVYRI